MRCSIWSIGSGLPAASAAKPLTCTCPGPDWNACWVTSMFAIGVVYTVKSQDVVEGCAPLLVGDFVGRSGRDEFDLLVVVDRDLLLREHGAQSGHRLLADVAASDEPFVVGFDGEHRAQPDQAGVVGEDPDDVGAPGDLAVEALKRIRGADLGPVLGREGVEGEHVGLGVLEQRGDLRQPALELLDGVAQPPAGLIAVGGGEDLADDRAERVVLVAAHVAAQVSEEVHGAALPRRAEDLRERRLQSRVRVGDGELDADQAARDERAQELAPERLGLGLTDVQADDLASAGLVDGVRDHDRLARDAAAVADLLDLGVDEQIRVAALQRPLPERLDLLVEQPRDPTDLALADAQPETLDELIDPPRRHAADIGLLDDRAERLLGALARLQEAREVAALTDLRDLQLDLPGPRVPPPRPIAVAMRRPILGPLAVSRADQLGDLGLHQLLRHHAHRLADPVAVLLTQHPTDALLDRHPLGTGHRWRLLSSTPWNEPTILSATVAATTPVPSDRSYTNPRCNP